MDRPRLRADRANVRARRTPPAPPLLPAARVVISGLRSDRSSQTGEPSARVAQQLAERPQHARRIHSSITLTPAGFRRIARPSVSPCCLSDARASTCPARVPGTDRPHRHAVRVHHNGDAVSGWTPLPTRRPACTSSGAVETRSRDAGRGLRIPARKRCAQHPPRPGQQHPVSPGRRRLAGRWPADPCSRAVPRRRLFAAIFFAFQSQAGHTDDAIGHPIAGPGDPKRGGGHRANRGGAGQPGRR
jgi:hypothetical protein